MYNTEYGVLRNLNRNDAGVPPVYGVTPIQTRRARAPQHFPKMDERTISYYKPGTTGAIQVWGGGVCKLQRFKNRSVWKE